MGGQAGGQRNRGLCCMTFCTEVPQGCTGEEILPDKLGRIGVATFNPTSKSFFLEDDLAEAALEESTEGEDEVQAAALVTHWRRSIGAAHLVFEDGWRPSIHEQDVRAVLEHHRFGLPAVLQSPSVHWALFGRTLAKSAKDGCEELPEASFPGFIEGDAAPSVASRRQRQPLGWHRVGLEDLDLGDEEADHLLPDAGPSEEPMVPSSRRCGAGGFLMTGPRSEGASISISALAHACAQRPRNPSLLTSSPFPSHQQSLEMGKRIATTLPLSTAFEWSRSVPG